MAEHRQDRVAGTDRTRPDGASARGASPDEPEYDEPEYDELDDGEPDYGDADYVPGADEMSPAEI